ncbi:PREDICTED: uncharacterized protein LOC105364617, partial [Ceratosolen solmsi marchali]|uniref:Uncharacterized protein LOC105364617 n=1 Tax=Ceratosolen solmsi marchali TaxID=326594 RepID=A0AAJ6YMQ3_9HYME
MSSPGYSAGAVSGPPPPPPPPVPGQVPALRINTASEVGPRKSQLGPQDPYEPPAAIQNAMMTKDKKPFTYTPGMGGKLDLSQIRSPRMARRVAKNANDEGIEGPPKSALAQTPHQQHQSTGIYAQPQVAVPVFPQGIPQQPPINLKNSTLPRSLPGGGIIVPVIERQADPVPRPVVKVETKIQPVANSSPDTLTPPMSPTQVTLSKAPTPWMQKQAKQSEELPEWAKRTGGSPGQDGPFPDPSSPLLHEFSSSPRQIVNLPRQQQQQYQQQSPQQYQQQYQQQSPQQYQQQYQQQSPQQYQQQQQPMRPVRQDSERIIPIRIEDRPSVFSAMNEPGHHQLMNSAPHHQSRWGNPVGQSGYQQAQGGTHIIPIQLDGQQQYQVPNTVPSHNIANNNQTQYNQANSIPISNHQVIEPGPVQSKSFRVLQKITDTDPDQIDEEQLRKLQLTEDDRYLMNKFKEQVDGDTYLHKEEDPRYRGAAIPSRAFRYLQNMTDSGDSANSNPTAKTVSPTIKKQNTNSKTFDEEVVPVTYIPASEQQVPEPKKYMGGAIPSRSFKILQAMTAPESIGNHSGSEEDVGPDRGSKNHKDKERDISAKFFARSNDYESYIAYSTEKYPLNKQLHTRTLGNVNNGEYDRKKVELVDDHKDIGIGGMNDEEKTEDKGEKEEENKEKDKEDEEEDEHCSENNVERCRWIDRENNIDNTTVNVSLPLRPKYSVSEKNEDTTTVIVGDSAIVANVDTCVDFTFKKLSRPIKDEDRLIGEGARIKPTFIVTATDEDQSDVTEPADATYSSYSTVQDKSQTLLSVRNHSREEITDDDDSGVTSDMSRIISEADTDSECCPVAVDALPPSRLESAPTLRRSLNKYHRTQTHSRLFRLLNEEQLQGSGGQDEHSSNSSGPSSPDGSRPHDSASLRTARQRLPTRPKSLDCEALLKRRQNCEQDNYYRTWKNGSGGGGSG